MGWLTPDERLKVSKRYLVNSEFMCDWCNLPIPIDEIPVVDSNKGYHKWDELRSPKQCRSFHGRYPKCTYHQGVCNDLRLGKRIKNKGEYEMSKKTKKVKKSKSKKSERSEKKSKKSTKSKGHSDKAVEKKILAFVKKKEEHYTKGRLLKKLSEDNDKSVIRASIAHLWASKKLRKKNNKYVLVA